MEKEIANQVKEAQRVPYKINPRRNMPKHILIKLRPTQRKNIKSSKRGATSNIQGKSYTFNCWSFRKILQGRREWQDIFKVLKGNNLQARLLYPARISFKIDGEIKTFSDKKKLSKFSTTKPALKQMLNRLVYQEIQQKKKDLQNQPQTIRKWQ